MRHERRLVATLGLCLRTVRITTRWLPVTSKWTYHSPTLNNPAFPNPPSPFLNFPLPPYSPLLSLQTLPEPSDLPHAPRLLSRKWPRTTTFQIRQRRPPQNPLLPVKPVPTISQTLLNAPATLKARENPRKQQKTSQPLAPARSTFHLRINSPLTLTLPTPQRSPYDLSRHHSRSHHQRTHPRY